MKICTECKWSSREDDRSLRCKHADTGRNPVNGDRYDSMTYCADARDSLALCGIEGRLWELIEGNT